MLALTNRHLVDRTYIPFDRKLWRSICAKTLKFYPKALTPCTFQEVLQNYRGMKKRSYYNAMINLQQNGWHKKYTQVKMFVKPDRYATADAPMKDPRAIQYRSMEFNLVFSKYIKSFEHAIYQDLTYGVVSGTRVIAKCLNNYERAELLLTKTSYFRKPRFVLLDHSRFDSTINVEHLKTTHKKYQRAFHSRELNVCTRAQLNNVGWSKSGIKYRTKGTRMSGDADTACGNTVVNADALWGFLQGSNIAKYDYLLDGDDSVVIVESSDIERLDYTLFGRLGFDTKHQVVNDIIDVEFCQCKLIRAQRPVLVRNPARVMSHSMVSRKYYPIHTYNRWLAGNGMCESAVNVGVPVLQAFGNKLARMSPKPLFDEKTRWRMGSCEPKFEPVTLQARCDMAQAWGIPLEVQRLIENNDTSISYNYIWDSETRRLYTSLAGGKRPKRLLHKYAETITTIHRLTVGYKSLPASSSSCWWCSG